MKIVYIFIIYLFSLFEFYNIIINASDSECNYHETYTDLVTSNSPYLHTEYYTTKCGWFGRCNKIRTVWKNKIIYQRADRVRLVEKCCDGYEKRNGVCQYYCNNECLNGFCSGPSECTCSPNYHKVTENDCELDCNNCDNGYCHLPNECICNQGYKMNITNKKCEPVCNSCFNGKCITPNNCKCNEGYNTSIILGLCTPICSEDCINGYCISPNVCECSYGFKHSKASGNNYSSIICEPMCDQECGPNSICSSPNLCKCLDGYKNSVNLTDKCEPVCTQDCGIGAYCNRPNQCKCLTGYEQSYRNSTVLCEPICLSGCPNGKCLASPDKCGNCTQGYTINNITEQCEPMICSSECLNGKCIGLPDTCECYVGYKLNELNRCVPICLNECINGICVKPNICECLNGYQMTNNTGDEEICEISPTINSHPTTFCDSSCFICHHNNETLLNECKCNKGYKLNNNMNACEIDCPSKCIWQQNNSSENYSCNCNGNEITEWKDQCQPFPCVETILNSYCDNFQKKCVCINGYEYINETNDMPAQCEYNIEEIVDLQETNNDSTCITPYCLIKNCSEILTNETSNNCHCDNGYVEVNSTHCRPMCTSLINDDNNTINGCINGHCIEPELCECFAGYEAINNTVCISSNEYNKLIRVGSSKVLSISITSTVVSLFVLIIVGAIVYYTKYKPINYPVEPIYYNDEVENTC